MYSVYSDDVCIYSDISPLESVKLVNPKLTMEDSAAGTFDFTIPPGNTGYDTVERLTSTIVVKRDNEEIWSGRVISESEDFYKRRKITCEGELAILNDTCQPPAEYHTSISDFFTSVLNIHNAKVPENKKFYPGIITVTDNNDYIYRYTNYESTMKVINEKLIDKLGGHLRIRKVDGKRYLDYLAEYPNTSPQIINFGRNLMDFTKNFDATKIVTVIIPRGERLEESPIEALEAYLTVESVNDGSIYVKNQTAIDEFGWIEAVIDWEDVTEASTLLTKAQAYLSQGQYEDLTIEIQAIDLHNLNPDIKALELLDQVRCISEPHGLDKTFPVTKVTIPLNEPNSITLTLGEKSSRNLTSTVNKSQSSILETIDNLPSKSSILNAAQNNASQLISSATNGYVTILKTADGSEAAEILITDEADYTKAQKVWRWNANGLGFSNTGYNGTYNIAMTMDGHFVANAITIDGLEVGKNVTMGPDAVISWGNVTNQPTIPTATSQLTNDSSYATTDQIPTDNSQLANGSGYETASSIKSTVITKDYIESLKVKAGSVECENLTGSKISGKEFYQENDVRKLTIANSVIYGGRKDYDTIGMIDFGNKVEEHQCIYIGGKGLMQGLRFDTAFNYVGFAGVTYATPTYTQFSVGGVRFTFVNGWLVDAT